jgi:hypothetical protein
LTGKRAFEGESVVETLGAVMNKEPDWTQVPMRAQRLVRWSLEKDRKQRLQAIGDARRWLEKEILAAPAEMPVFAIALRHGAMQGGSGARYRISWSLLGSLARDSASGSPANAA